MNHTIACIIATAVVLGLGASEEACLDRPVARAEPLTTTTFSTTIAENTVDQIDILFDIDNSASMGDKQALLELAIPDLITRLVQPNCADATNNLVPSTLVNGAPTCAAGQSLEFRPVHDMHLGIVSSSLGARGGDLCLPDQMTNLGEPFLDGMPSISSHTDDQGHLLSRSAANGETETTSPESFLDWFPLPASPDDPAPNVGIPAVLPPATDITDVTALETNFANLVTGVHAFGCGIESQLESWYRFLIQPDPYASIAPMTSTLPPPGAWVGYDQTIIQQRHDFLRPSSLVAIIVLSDENDSEIDTRAYGGSTYEFMVNGTPLGENGSGPVYNPPRGTSACSQTPDSPQCMSCLSEAAAGDPNCTLTQGKYTSPVDWGNDANLRHVHMKQKYGLDRLQYPVQRYYLGLTSPTVPDRTMEYPAGAPFYQGGTAQLNGGVWAPGDTSQLNCTNPLFAPAQSDGSTSLPDGSDMSPATLCNTAHPAIVGRSRGAGLVFFAHIGGVPHELLQAQPGAVDPTTELVTCAAGTNPLDCPQKDTLTPADWLKILGNGAAQGTPTSGPSYDYSGIDPHMVESFKPRDATVVPPGTTPLAASPPQPLGGGADSISGREWVTDSSADAGGTPQPVHVNVPVDLEYACIFPLVDPATGAATPRDCSNSATTASGAWVDFFNQEACDCSTEGLTSLDPTAIPAVCGQCPGAGANSCSQGGTDYNLQYYAKAYPTIREIELVHLMGSQGILSSLCPIHSRYAVGADGVPDMGDAVFGYRPAVTSIVNRLKTALTSACLPERLAPAVTTAENTQPGCAVGDVCVPCVILATLAPTDSNSCADYAQAGLPLSMPSDSVLANFRELSGKGAATGTVCQVSQIPYVAIDANDSASCENDSALGWCYVQGEKAGQGCTVDNTPQAIVFSQGTESGQTSLPKGSVVSLQCLEQTFGGVDGG